MLVMPDTLPRGAGYPGEDDAYDFGSGAGFYLDATQRPWSQRYNMYSYVTKELPALVASHFPADMGHQGIMGHLMGGHRAISIHLKRSEEHTSELQSIMRILYAVFCLNKNKNQHLIHP